MPQLENHDPNVRLQGASEDQLILSAYRLMLAVRATLAILSDPEHPAHAEKLLLSLAVDGLLARVEQMVTRMEMARYPETGVILGFDPPLPGDDDAD
jgi:hypothetical protein